MILKEGRLFTEGDAYSINTLITVAETQGLQLARRPDVGLGLLKKDTLPMIDALKELAVSAACNEGEPTEYFDRINGNADRTTMFAVEHYAKKGLELLGD